MTHLAHILTSALDASSLAAAADARAYTPFLDPLDLHDQWWFTLIPIAFFVSMAYKGVRMKTLEGYWRYTLLMTAQIILGMIGISVFLYVLVEVLVPVLE